MRNRDAPVHAGFAGKDLDFQHLGSCQILEEGGDGNAARCAGFAHGFCVLSDVADVVYLQDDYYDADRQLGITYLDPEVGIEWPEGLELFGNDRDRDAPRLSEMSPDDLPG